MVIYCVGLGAVAPSVSAGAVASGTTLSTANAPVTVTFGNQTVTAGFCGTDAGARGVISSERQRAAGRDAGRSGSSDDFGRRKKQLQIHLHGDSLSDY